MLHLIALAVLATIFRDPQLLQDLDGDVAQWSESPALPTPLSNVEQHTPTAYTQHNYVTHKDHSLVYHDVDMGALVTVCTLAITLMLVYGAIRGLPGYLMPFFCLQLFDLAITTLTATGYLCYLRSVHQLVAEARRVPWRAELLRLPAPALALLVLLAFLVAMMVKAYCINIVWRCYKYLTLRQDALLLGPYVVSGDAVPVTLPAPRPAPDAALLPAYEEAVKQAPPPSYQVATQVPAGGSGQASTEPPAATAVVILPQESTANQSRV